MRTGREDAACKSTSRLYFGPRFSRHSCRSRNTSSITNRQPSRVPDTDLSDYRHFGRTILSELIVPDLGHERYPPLPKPTILGRKISDAGEILLEQPIVYDRRKIWGSLEADTTVDPLMRLQNMATMAFVGSRDSLFDIGRSETSVITVTPNENRDGRVEEGLKRDCDIWAGTLTSIAQHHDRPIGPRNLLS